MDLDEKVQGYLRRSYGIDTKLLGIEALGEGVHGVGYLIKFSTPLEEHRLIMKALFPSRFGHDHYSDRAQVLLLANANYGEMPRAYKGSRCGRGVSRQAHIGKGCQRILHFYEGGQGENLTSRISIAILEAWISR